VNGVHSFSEQAGGRAGRRARASVWQGGRGRLQLVERPRSRALSAAAGCACMPHPASQLQLANLLAAGAPAVGGAVACLLDHTLLQEAQQAGQEAGGEPVQSWSWSAGRRQWHALLLLLLLLLLPPPRPPPPPPPRPPPPLAECACHSWGWNMRLDWLGWTNDSRVDCSCHAGSGGSLAARCPHSKRNGGCLRAPEGAAGAGGQSGG
jgi:hypothetical protein